LAKFKTLPKVSRQVRFEQKMPKTLFRNHFALPLGRTGVGPPLRFKLPIPFWEKQRIFLPLATQLTLHQRVLNGAAAPYTQQA
jgi:hypothetical protein